MPPNAKTIAVPTNEIRKNYLYCYLIECFITITPPSINAGS
jgi:hypothetical protein